MSQRDHRARAIPAQEHCSQRDKLHGKSILFCRDAVGLYNQPMFVALFFAAAAVAAPIPGVDVCSAMIPPALAAQLARDFPDYRLPRLADAPTERLASMADAGDWPCPFVAIGDFDGDGKLDRALALAHNSDPSVRLIAARQTAAARQWSIELRQDWPLPLAEFVVEPLEAGFYEQTKTNADVAAQLDNMQSIQSDCPGFQAGELRGPRAAFFLVGEVWQRIWLAD